MTKAIFKHVLPPLGFGRAPLEYGLLARAEKIAGRLEQGGQPDDLLLPAEVARAIGCDVSWMMRQWEKTGRGPEPTPVGQRWVFRRRHVVAWLAFLARKHKALVAA